MTLARDVTFSGRRIWTSPPEIFRNSNAHIYRNVSGKKWLLRSDFPVHVHFDSQLVAACGGPYGSHMRFVTATDEPRAVRFSFPVGYGVNTAGALQTADLYARHGTCSLESASEMDDEPLLPNPRDMARNLLHYNHIFVNPTAGLWPWTLGQFLVAADWRQPGTGSANMMPNEIWIWNHTISVEESLLPANGGERPYEVLLHKENNPAGDGTYKILDGALTGGGTDAYTTGPLAWVGYSGVQKSHNHLGGIKVPLRSLYQPWAAETPRLEFFVYGPAVTAGTIVVRGGIDFSYVI